MSYDMSISAQGNPANGTYLVTLGNALASLTSLGVPIVSGTSMQAQGVLISVETQAARVIFGAAKEGAKGHVLAKDASAMFGGQAAVAAIKLGNATDDSVSTVEVTVFF